MAALSQDSSLLQAFKENKDVYATIGTGVFKNDYWDNMEHYPDGTKNEDGNKRRKKCKTLLLGMMYGMGPNLISQRMGVTVDEGKQIIEDFYNSFSSVKDWKARITDIAYKTSYVEDAFGRRRQLTDLLLPKYEFEDYNIEGGFNPFLGTSDLKFATSSKLIDKYSKELEECNSFKSVNKLKEDAKSNKVIIKDNTGFISRAERQCVNAAIQGCLSYDTEIYTTQGIKKIGDLKNQEISVWDGNDWSKAVVLPSGKKRKCILTTTTGVEIVCSPDHKFLTVSTRGTEVFKKLSEIKVSDRIIITENAPHIDNTIKLRDITGINYFAVYNKHDYSFDDISDDYTRGQILGRIASNGSYIFREDGGSVIYILVAEHEKELLDYFENNLPWKYSVQILQKKNQKLYSLQITSKSLVEECLYLDIKHQINEYFYKNTDCLRGFISGFFDGDGTALNETIQLVFGKQSDFSHITKQIQNALMVFGIKSTAKEFGDRYCVTVRKHESKLFAERIGFIDSNKQLLAENIDTKCDNHTFNGKVIANIKSIVDTDDYIDMYDVCNTERGYFIANGFVTHNSAASMTKKAMISIYNDQIMKDLGFKLLIGVHDRL